MLKTVGAVVLVGAVVFGVSVYAGLLDFNADAELTQKGRNEIRELRNEAADLIESAGGAAAEAARD